MSLDKKGRSFDPEIHVTRNGEPVLNKDGTLKCKPFAKVVTPQGDIIEEQPRQRRRKKQNLSQDLRLDDRNPRPGFVRRWVNDIEGRVQRFIDNDYEPVEDGQQTIRRGVGTGMESVLMEIPEEWYQENQDEKAKQIRTLDQQTEKLGEGEYSPRGKESALSTDENPLR